jgi:hypothetical protein
MILASIRSQSAFLSYSNLDGLKACFGGEKQKHGWLMASSIGAPQTGTAQNDTFPVRSASVCGSPAN